MDIFPSEVPDMLFIFQALSSFFSFSRVKWLKNAFYIMKYFSPSPKASAWTYTKELRLVAVERFFNSYSSHIWNLQEA